jgi:16S rRNA (uracil1498-N3)-methyltransferase
VLRLALVSGASTIARMATHREPEAAWRARRMFWLAATPESGEAQLEPADEQHLLRVLRARPGERIAGLDGSGTAWPLVVESVDKHGVSVRLDGEARHEAEAGAAGARVPWIELAIAWPRPQVGEDMLDGLVQLGCARVTALVSGRSQEWSRDWTPARRERLERVVREACKQSRRLWRIELGGPLELESWLSERASGAESGTCAVLEPRAERLLAPSVREQRERRPDVRLSLVVGPEGGWSAEERAALAARGLPELALAGHVLRTELAAQTAAAIALQP